MDASDLLEPTLGLVGAFLDLCVELVDGLEGLCAGVLAEGLDVALRAAGLPVGLCDLFESLSADVALDD